MVVEVEEGAQAQAHEEDEERHECGRVAERGDGRVLLVLGRHVRRAEQHDRQRHRVQDRDDRQAQEDPVRDEHQLRAFVTMHNYALSSTLLYSSHNA